MNAGLLFEGIGGFGLACERAGIEHAWSSEIDRHASAVLDHHWPHVKNLGDIHEIRNAPRVDVLTGGFPCQDYSVAGRGAGLAGDRGALWWQFHRLIAELDPRWVVAENVDGLTNRTHRASLRTIIGSMVSLGYGVVWRVFDAQFFGLAQRRKRVFIVGHSGGRPRPEILSLAEGMFGHPAPSREAEQDIAAALESRATPDRLRAERGHIVGFSPGATDPVSVEGIVPTISARNGDQESDIRIRKLTPLECERLQGFPDGWTDIPGNSDTQRYRQLGNAVAVPVAEWIMARIAAA